ENLCELALHAMFGARGSLLLLKKIERQLPAEYLVFDLLKIQQADGLFLKFINSGITALRGGLQNRHRCRLHCKSVVQFGENSRDHDRCRMRIDEVPLGPE